MGTKRYDKKQDRFLGFSFIALGILGAIAKFSTHQNDWRPGVIVKLVLILAVFVLGIWFVLRKNK